MVILPINASQIDSLETNPRFMLTTECTCSACNTPFVIVVVCLGSTADQDLEDYKVGNWLSTAQNWVSGLFNARDQRFHAFSKVRVRLRPSQLFRIRQKFELNAKSRCPRCADRFDISVRGV